MRKDLTLPLWGGRVLGGALLAVAVTAGAISLTLNAVHGLEAGLAAGLAFGLADIGKILLPVVAGLIGWSRQMKATAAICVAVSLWSAVNVYLDGAGRDLLAKQHGQSVYAEVQKQLAELEAELSSLRTLVAAEAAKGGCGRNCRALTEQASHATERLQIARAARANMQPVEISGLAATLAMATGTKPDGIARSIGAVKALLFLALIEVLAWLSLPAMALLSQTDRHQMMFNAAPAAKPLQSIAKPATSGTKAYYLARLEREHPEIARKVYGGELSVHKACIAAGLRKAPAKDWSKPAAYRIAVSERQLHVNPDTIAPTLKRAVRQPASPRQRASV